MSYSQKDTTNIARNLLYMEVLGIGGYGSVNYERLIYYKNALTFTTRFGISTYHIKDYMNKFNPDILIPISIYGCLGKNNKIELGIGQTYTNIVHYDLTDLKPSRTFNFHSNFSIGYRFQKKTSGVFFRCAYTPLIMYNRYFRNWGCLSIGYSF